MTSRVTLCQLIKDNHLYAEKLHAPEKKTDEGEGFEPPNGQWGTSPGMVWKHPTAIPSVAWCAAWIHRLLRVCTLSPGQQLPRAAAGDAASDRSNRTGQKSTPRNQNRWKRKGHKEACCTNAFIVHNWKHAVLPNDSFLLSIHTWIPEWAYRGSEGS